MPDPLFRCIFIFTVSLSPAVAQRDVAVERNPSSTSNRRIPMLKFVTLSVLLAAILVPKPLLAAFEVERVLSTDLSAAVLDVTTDSQDDLVFFLTPGMVMIYSTEEQTVLDQIPVEKEFDRIAFQADDRLVLTDTDSPRINVLRFSRIFDIDISGRAVKGPEDARITLVVFDDYQ